jgi:hypothetical protein
MSYFGLDAVHEELKTLLVDSKYPMDSSTPVTLAKMPTNHPKRSLEPYGKITRWRIYVSLRQFLG